MSIQEHSRQPRIPWTHSPSILDSNSVNKTLLMSVTLCYSRADPAAAPLSREAHQGGLDGKEQMGCLVYANECAYCAQAPVQLNLLDQCLAARSISFVRKSADQTRTTLSSSDLLGKIPRRAVPAPFGAGNKMLTLDLGSALVSLVGPGQCEESSRLKEPNGCDRRAFPGTDWLVQPSALHEG
jgi:hypothetical protein